MNIIDDMNKYDSYQMVFLKHLAEGIKRNIARHIQDEVLAKEIAEHVVFSVCCDIDGSTPMSLDGQPFIPSLHFEIDEETALCGPSWMHEYAFGFVDEAYSSET